MLQHQLHYARDRFEAAIRLSPRMLYAYHNLYTINRTLGHFTQARNYYQKAIDLYEEGWNANKFKDEISKCYYYAELIGCEHSTRAPDQWDHWEALLKEYHKYDPDDAETAGELFKLYLAKKQAIEDGHLMGQFLDGEKAVRVEQVYGQMREWFLKSTSQFETAIRQAKYNNKRKLLLVQFGRLYLNYEVYDKALEKFKEALSLKPDDVGALEGAGVASFKSGDYPNAIIYFRKALQQLEASLNIRCNLADTYRCSNKMDEAEQIYTRVLYVCPNYIDALIGLGECKKSAGDKAHDSGDQAEAELQYLDAKDHFKKVFTQRDASSTSKQLTSAEESALHYSFGYTKVRLYEIGGGRNAPLLLGARAELKKVKENFSEYLKAQKAIRTINNTLTVKPVKKLISGAIFLFALCLFLITQYIFFSNHFKEKNKTTTFELRSDALFIAAQKAGADSAQLLRLLAPLRFKKFDQLDKLQLAVDKLLPAELQPFVNMSTVTSKDTTREMAMQETTYGLLTFGGLVFMVIGLYLPYVTSIKLGVIDMAKNSAETVKANIQIIGKTD